MAVLELAIVLVAFGAMAIVFGAQERAEWRRLVAEADAVLERKRSSATVVFDEPAPHELRDAA
jgi:hypothetical protein